MEMIDSKKKLLPIPVVIAEAAQNLIDQGEVDLPLQVVLIAIAKEGSLPNANIYQAGNTVFLGHRGSKKPSTMVGRAFNADTPENLLDNGLKYFTYLSEIGIRDYFTAFSNPSYASAFKYMEKSSIGDKIRVESFPSKKNPKNTVVRVQILEKIEAQ